MEVYILGSNYHDINYGFETKVMRILLAEFHMHQCIGQTRRRFHGRFRNPCPIVFPPATPSYTKFFPPVTMHKQRFLHCSYGNSALFIWEFCLVHMGILPFEDISHGCFREHRTSPSCGPERPPPQLSCFSSLLVAFFFPILVIAAPFFERSCLQQIPFGTQFRPSLLSPLHVELQESFCCLCSELHYRLLGLQPRDLLSGRCCALATFCA